MAEEAYKCFQAILKSVPTWIADLESILVHCRATQRHDEAALELVPTDSNKTLVRKASRSSSMRSRHSLRRKASTEEKRKSEEDGKDAVLSPARVEKLQLSSQDALRLTQRKRKTASILSGQQSGPTKYRSRACLVVYYDGEVQKKFEELVTRVGTCRNTIRKAKMSAKMERLARGGSPGYDSGDIKGEEAFENEKPVMPAWNRRLIARTQEEDGGAGFDTVDGALEKSQALCERAAHQILRDGDCLLELAQAKKHMATALGTAEEEISVWETRAKQATDWIERHRLKEEKQGAHIVTGQVQQQTIEGLGFFPKDGMLDVDSSEGEESESDGENGNGNDYDLANMQLPPTLSRYGLQSARLVTRAH